MTIQEVTIAPVRPLLWPISTVAAFLSVRESCVRRLIADHELTAVRLDGRVLVHQDEAADFAEQLQYGHRSTVVYGHG